MKPQEETDFTQLLEDNKQSIYRICRIYAVPPIEAQDLFQEVVFQIWKSLPGFKGKSNINTWVYRITLNVCIRAKSQLKKNDFQTIRLDAVEFKTSEAIPDDDENEKYAALHACISSLNESDQALMVLYLEDLPYTKIAEISELTENHVAVKMKRIREKLLKCIASKLN